MFEVIDINSMHKDFMRKPDWSFAVLAAWPENIAGRLCVTAGFCTRSLIAGSEIPTVVRAFFQRGRIQFAWVSSIRFPAAQICFAKRRQLLAQLDSPVFRGHTIHLNKGYYV